jgi:ABC-type polysaccharide transport system permease subunit
MDVDITGRFGLIAIFVVVWIIISIVLWALFSKKVPSGGLAIISFFLSLVLVSGWLLVTSNKDSGVKNDVIKGIEINDPNLPENIEPPNLGPNTQLDLNN